MTSGMQTLYDFARNVLAPCADGILLEKYEDYCSGADIGIESKGDSTPASLADRETEAALRALIERAYPDHGIWGEEYGAQNLDRDYVWVLDPLDGTREFLAKNPGCFGALIGLLYQGRPVLGLCSDPVNKTLWISDEVKRASNGQSLKDSVICCTNPDLMFPLPENQAMVRAIRSKAKDFQTRLNCIGFMRILDGRADAVIESDLAIHDIAALIPLLNSGGACVLDFEGRDYSAAVFDLSQAKTQKYDIIAAGSEKLAQEILCEFVKQEVA